MHYDVLKFQAPFDRLNDYVDCPYVRLYKAVIIQALTDASNLSFNKSSSYKMANQARRWVFGEEYEEKFIDICDHAELDYKFVRETVRKGITLSAQKNEIIEKDKMCQLYSLIIHSTHKRKR